jgi:protein dithiol oxidoreductase (disulfide-forming)
MKFVTQLIGLGLGFAFSANMALAANNDLVVGTHYEVTAAKGSEQPMVEEFFNYACGACYSMEPFVDRIKTNNPGITVKKIPLELRPSWKIYVEAYYIGEKLGILDKSHAKIFHRLHVEKNHFNDKPEMKQFFLDLGVAEKDYDDIAKSYWLNTQVRLSKQYAMKNKVMSTPVFVVNQRFKLNSANFNSQDEIEQAIVSLSGVKK